MMGDHYYSEKPGSRLRITEMTETLRGREVKLFSGSGVFSIGRVDRGTKLLIEGCEITDGWRILDLGCGYGPVGISIAMSFPASQVVMTDLNTRAVKLARMGIRANNVQNAEAVQDDLFKSIEGKFDTILLNPPQNAGKDICFEMIRTSKLYLNQGGLLQLVVRHKKGGRMLSEFMEEIFGNLRIGDKGSGYRIYICEAR